MMSGMLVLFSYFRISATNCATLTGSVSIPSQHSRLAVVVLRSNTYLPSQFHVDNLSSAHVYLRMRDGETWDNIPQALLDDCAQLTKANSIEGPSVPSQSGYTW